MLRAGVLKGRTIALAGAAVGLADALEALGGTTAVNAAPASLGEGEAALGPRGESGGASASRSPDTLVADARATFAAAGGGYDGVRAALDGAFAATREVALAAWIDRPASGQVILVAPAPGAGRHAGAARAGLENLARSLATEWARHAVTTVAVLPGDATTDLALTDLVAWLASPAGAYLSGTALALDTLGPPTTG